MFHKSDIIGSGILGFFIAALFLVIAYMTTTVLRPDERPPAYYWAALLVVPLMSSLGIVAVRDLKERLAGVRVFSVLFQFYKFGLVGAANTLLDTAIYNVFLVTTGIAAGGEIIGFKAISFTVAVLHSYFWNKYWTFGTKSHIAAGELGKFVAISIAGLGIALGTVHVIINMIGPLEGVSPFVWANIGQAAAIVFSTVWNFVGYKFIVFGKKQP